MIQPHPRRRRVFSLMSLILMSSFACNLGSVPPKPAGLQSTAVQQNPPPAVTAVTAVTEVITSAPLAPTSAPAPNVVTATINLAATQTAYEAAGLATYLAGPLSRTQPAFNTSLTFYNYYSFEPLSFSNDYYFMRHQNFLGELTLVSTPLDYADATFRVVPGGANGSCIAFESYNYPGYFLRHENYRIKLQQSDGSHLFDQDSTFCPRTGLAHPLGISFESYNNYGFYLRHRDFHLYVESGTDDQFRFDATWVFAGPLAH